MPDMSPKKFALAAGLLLGWAPFAHATVFTGTLYYTYSSGGENVDSVTYNYDDSTHSFGVGPINGIAALPGADGIIFDAHGNLLVGGQSSNKVFQITPTGVPVSNASSNTSSFHLTLDPSGNKVYTSTFEGPLETLALTPTLNPAVQTAITGGDGSITQVAFGHGTVFYVNGSPNGNGNLGTINLSTGVTNRLYTGVAPAHGLIYDPYTDLMTMFGDGKTGTMNATNGSGLQVSGPIACDFDQGAVDGHGHALVAGCNEITLIDYSVSHDITNPDFVGFATGFDSIDDVAPLVGAGSQVGAPEPATLVLLGSGLLGLGAIRRRSRR